MTTQIIVIANQKGGVGKTTTTVNLATALAAVHKKVLLIDLDPQGNATTGFGLSVNTTLSGTYQALVNDEDSPPITSPTPIPGLELLASSVDLSGAELELVGLENREYKLKNALARHFRNYDYILIDCPPALGLLTLNALCAATHILIPLQCEYYALEGLSHLLKTVSQIKIRLNPALEILGVVLTMYDKRNSLNELVAEDVRSILGDKVFKTVIPRNIRVSEAPSYGKPVLLYDVASAGAHAYIKLAAELLKWRK